MTDEKKQRILSKLETAIDSFALAKTMIAEEDGHDYDGEYDLCRNIQTDLYNLQVGLIRRFFKS